MSFVMQVGLIKKHKMNTELIEKHQELIIKRMRLDRFFSDFLSENELDDTDTNTQEWKMYKNKIKEYNDLSYSIKSTEYKLKNNR